MSEQNTSCGPCGYIKNYRNATKWCTSCKKGFCENCGQAHVSAKITINHKLISLDDNHKVGDFSISQICETHEKLYTFFCKTHDVPLCESCVSSMHKCCKNVIPLEEAAKNAIRSTALAYLQESIDITLKAVTSVVFDRYSAIQNIVKQEQQIRGIIHEAREAIIKQLDMLEQKLLFEFEESYKTCILKHERSHEYFQMVEKTFHELKKQTEQLSKLSSDLQIFLETRQLSKTFDIYIKAATKEVDTTRNYKVQAVINPTLNAISKTLDSFGNIEIIETNANLSLKSANEEQAQTPIIKFQNVLDTQLQLKHKFKIKSSKVSGCTMLPSGNILIAEYAEKKQLMEYNEKGDHVRDIGVSRLPFDLTTICASTIAVSYGQKQFIEIINIDKNAVEKRIKFRNNCYGISYQDWSLFTVVCYEGIVISDMSGKELRTIECDVLGVNHLTTTKERIYYTDSFKNSLHCYNMAGDVIWVFNKFIGKIPYGLSADEKQNVFVAGWGSNILAIISHNGTLSKTLLTKSDGLQPSVVHYDKNKKVLFVNDENNCNAALFNVK